MTSGSGYDSTDALRIGVLDLGTNTFNLLIGELVTVEGKEEVHSCFTDRAPVKLRKGNDAAGAISEAARERGVQALERHIMTLKEWGCQERIAIGTSGLRTASNADAFLEEIRARTGLIPEIIEGEREAELISKGVRAAMPLGKEPTLILDIGGGSSEFIIADAEQTHWKRSFEIGAARLLQEIDPSDPISADEHQVARRSALKMLAPLEEPLKDHKPRTLVGCSGSFESIADMAYYHLQGAEDPTDRSAVKVELSHYRKLHQILLASTLDERREMQGLAEMRAEMIVLGSILIETVMELAGTEHFFTSYYALREGALMEAASKHST